MKKLVTILLALAMIFAMSIPAFAAEETEEVTLKVTPAADGIVRTYEGHRLLKLISMSVKDTGHTCDGVTHKADCYNYAYEVVPQYRTILQEEVAHYAGTGFWGNVVQPDTDKISDDDIVRYLSLLSKDEGDTFGTMRKVADRIYRAINDAQLTPEATAFNTSTGIGRGFWIFADVTDVADQEYANSLVIVRALTQEDITLTPKTGLPTLTKKVQDIEDSENIEINNMLWYDSADHDIGDNVPFKLTATLPSNVQYYNNYILTFHDTLAPGLELSASNRLNPNGSFKVFMYEDAGTAAQDYNLDNGTDVSIHFSVVEDKDHDLCSFELTGDIYAIPNAHTVITPATVFVVYYEARLLENAKLGAEGNANTAYLEYSNDPYDKNSTSQTEVDTVKVFTYSISVTKKDQDGNALPGASFTLFKIYQDGRKVPVGGGKQGPGADKTVFTWEGLDDGDYILEETDVPEGFNGMASRTFSIMANHDQESEEPQLRTLASTNYAGDQEDGVISFDVINRTGAALPETGAEGTFFLIAGGTMLVVLAAVFMITRKKMSIYED